MIEVMVKRVKYADGDLTGLFWKLILYFGYLLLLSFLSLYRLLPSNGEYSLIIYGGERNSGWDK